MVRKPLTVIIVTLSALKGMSRQFIQRIKAMLLCMVCLSTLSMQRSKHANALIAMFVETVETGVCGSYTTSYTEYYAVWKLYSTLYKVASRLNIEPIFNPQKVLENWDWGLFNHTINTIYVNTVDTRQGSLMHSMLSMSTLLIHSLHNILTCNGMHVNAVDAIELQCRF